MPFKKEILLEEIFSGLSFIMLKPDKQVPYISKGFQDAFKIPEIKNIDKSLDFVFKVIGLEEQSVKNEICERICKGLDYFVEFGNDTLYFLPIVFNKDDISVIEISNSPTGKSVFHSLKQKDELLKIITNIFEKLVKNSDINELLETIAASIYNSIFPFYHISIFLLDDSKEYVYLAAMEGANKEFYIDEFPDGYFQEVDKGIIGSVIQSRKKRVVENVLKEPDYYKIGDSPTVTEICLPVIYNNEIYGVINIESKIKYVPDDTQLSILENIGHYLGIAINSQMLVFELDRQKDEQEKYIAELQESKERIENQTFDIIENMEEIEEARKFIARQNEKIQSELEIAGSLLKKLLPSIPEMPGINFGIWFEPSASLGGDFYDFKMLDDGSLLFVQVDVTGHGVSSALLAAQSKIAFQNAAAHYESPGKLLEDLNLEFKNLNDTDLFFSAFAGVIDVNKKILHYSNAAHPFPLLFKENEVAELDTDGFLIGVLPAMSYENKSIEIVEGDVLVVYTDGLIEARNENDKMYGTDGLKQYINKYMHKIELNVLLKNVIQDIKVFCNDSIDDDLTVLVFQIK